MAILLQAPYFAAYDANGDPLNAGKVYTYEAGTDTPKDTYTTSAASIAHTNPVVLDAAGRKEIWLNGNYKIKVTDANDVEIDTVDNIVGASATGDMNSDVYDAANIQEQLVGLTAVQTLTNKTLTAPILTNPGIVGTTTNDNASAGNVGEVIESTLASGSATSLTTSTAKTVTSISLTAGDWDVWGNIWVTPAGSLTRLRIDLSATDNTIVTAPNGGGSNQSSNAGGTGAAISINATRRVSVASTTTYYLVASADFSSTATAYGYIGARRRR